MGQIRKKGVKGNKDQLGLSKYPEKKLLHNSFVYLVTSYYQNGAYLHHLPLYKLTRLFCPQLDQGSL